jgi:hypothetical protein
MAKTYLTATVLRKAAEYIASAESEQFMCTVIKYECYGFSNPHSSAARREFENLLRKHGVSTSGFLDNELSDATWQERNNVRVMFLLMLAEMVAYKPNGGKRKPVETVRDVACEGEDAVVAPKNERDRFVNEYDNKPIGDDFTIDGLIVRVATVDPAYKWYNANQKPTFAGIYERDYGIKDKPNKSWRDYQYFDGYNWYYGSDNLHGTVRNYKRGKLNSICNVPHAWRFVRPEFIKQDMGEPTV